VNIAIIPARKGSKRIRNKNIKFFKNKPIIYWTINTLKKSKLFNSIIVTSDSQKILNYSKNAGCDILIKRSPDISNDTASTHSAIKHALKNLNLKVNDKTKIFCIYPCNPLLQINDLRKSLLVLKKKQNNYIFPVSRVLNQKSNLIFLNKSNKVQMVKYPKKIFINKKSFNDAGQFYLAFFKTWIKFKDIHKHGACIQIPSWRALDINYPSDWKKAEAIFNYINNVSRQ
jgi:pseudaminic acid cytidylyltransferase